MEGLAYEQEKLRHHTCGHVDTIIDDYSMRTEKSGRENEGENWRSHSIHLYAPQYVAISKGFFAEQGLDVELTTTPGGDKTMTALLSGGIDVALVGSETSIYVQQQGSGDPVINFSQLTQTDGTFLVTRKPLQGKFDWSQLKGSVFLGQRVGGMPQMAGEFTLKKFGINPKQDLKLIQNIDFANIPSAFVSGTGIMFSYLSLRQRCWKRKERVM